jgi:hypothetical protein
MIWVTKDDWGSRTGMEGMQFWRRQHGVGLRSIASRARPLGFQCCSMIPSCRCLTSLSFYASVFLSENRKSTIHFRVFFLSRTKWVNIYTVPKQCVWLIISSIWVLATKANSNKTKTKATTAELTEKPMPWQNGWGVNKGSGWKGGERCQMGDGMCSLVLCYIMGASLEHTLGLQVPCALKPWGVPAPCMWIHTEWEMEAEGMFSLLSGEAGSLSTITVEGRKQTGNRLCCTVV